MSNHLNFNYIVKFANQTFLTRPSAHPFSNYYSDYASPYDRSESYRFANKIVAQIVAYLVKGTVLDMGKPIRYEEGKTYLTIGGEPFTVTECKDELGGYETVCNAEGKHRYNRTKHAWDAGRITGSKWTKDCLRYPPEEVKNPLAK